MRERLLKVKVRIKELRSQRSVQILLWILVGLSIGSFAFSVFAMSSMHTYTPCVSPERLKMGDMIFSLPRPGKLRPRYVERLLPGNKSESLKMEELCHATEPIEIKWWTADIQLNDLMEGLDKILNKDGYPLSKFGIRVGFSNNSLGPNFRTDYESVRVALEVDNIKLEDLPVQDGFYVLTYDRRTTTKRNEEQRKKLRENFYNSTRMTGGNIYISKDPTFRDPNGDPVVFYCATFGEREDNCSFTVIEEKTRYYGVEGIGPLFPKSRWRELYERLYLFIHSFIEKPVSK